MLKLLPFYSGSEVYRLLTDSVAHGYPRPISEVFPGLPTDLDAAFYYPNSGKTFFFKVKVIVN